MLYTGTPSLYSSKYSLLNDIVKKLEQRRKSVGKIFYVKIGTSETIRDGVVVNLENVKRISDHVPKHFKPLNNEQLGYYLAGLIDGDGHFSKAQQLVIVFSSPDAFLAYYIKSRIGFGTVKEVKSKKIFLFIITKSKGLEKIFCLINGKIRTQSKYDIINKYIFNDPCLNLRMDFKLNNSDCLNNHWLAGFSDALGFFQVISLGYQIKLSFLIKYVNINLLTLIRSFLGGKISYNKIEDSYTYDSSSFGSARKTIKYFDNYPLLSRKHINYLKWRKVYLNTFKNQKLNYSTESNKVLLADSKFNLDPNWIRGFVDGEGCFSIIILKYPQYKLGWRTKTMFSITLHQKDITILENIQACFGGIGKIYPQAR